MKIKKKIAIDVQNKYNVYGGKSQNWVIERNNSKNTF